MIEHKHVIVRALVNDPPAKEDMDKMHKWFGDLVVSLGMNILSGPHFAYVDMPGNKGFTGVCIIETSHIALHIWDEEKPSLFQLDVYTCGKMDLSIIFEALKKFNPTKVTYNYLDRENDISLLETGEYNYA